MEKWSFPASSPGTQTQDLACFLGIAGGNPDMTPANLPALAAGHSDPEVKTYKFVPGLYADFYDDSWELEGCPLVATTFVVSFSTRNNSVPGEVWLFQDHRPTIAHWSAETFVRTLNPQYQLPAVESPADEVE